MMSDQIEDRWKWWAGRDEERMMIGPCETREQAIAQARSDASGEFFDPKDGKWKVGIYIVEARQDPLRLADWVDADEILCRADESLCESDRTSSEHDDGPWFEVTPAQEYDLDARIKRAINEWQDNHGLVFPTNTFSATRNSEYLVVLHPDDDRQGESP